MSAAVSSDRNSAGASIAILGVPFDHLTLAQAAQRIEEMIASRRPHCLITANVDFLVQAQEDVELRRIFFEADMVLCDGTPLVWASRLLGNPLPERVAGADLVPLLIRIAARRGHRIFLLGATPESAERAIRNLKAGFPNLPIAGYYSPPFSPLLEMDHEEIRRRIKEAKPDMLFVSFGCPKQEKWIAMHFRDLGVPVCVGVGATIDFLAGQVRRAPVWIQRCGFEWLFRLAQEPRRLFRRYAKDFWVFGWKILVQWHGLQLRRRARPVRPATGPLVRSDRHWQRIPLPERLDAAAVRNGLALVEEAISEKKHGLLDASRVGFVDSTGVGFLIRAHKRFRAAGCQLLLLSPSAAMSRALELMKLSGFFDCAADIPAAERLLAARAQELSACVALRTPAASNPLLWRGEITAANAAAVWEATQAHLLSAPRRECVLDLARVRFIDSTGVGLLVRAKKMARRERIALSFVSVPPVVQNVIRLSRLEEFLFAEEVFEAATVPAPRADAGVIGDFVPIERTELLQAGEQ
jgi:N-acetylglucosaminyldiphosphoundecaprenol N-acetyl-beta-D-mannosaminyltransferase